MRVSALLCFLLAMAVSVCGQEQSDAGTAAAIRALEKEWIVAQSRNDSRALDLIFDNALVYVEYGHLVSKSEYLARIKSQPSSLDLVTIEAVNVRTFHTTAIVVGTYLETQFNKTKPVVQRWKFLDTWAYKKNGWVLVAAGAAPVK